MDRRLSILLSQVAVIAFCAVPVQVVNGFLLSVTRAFPNALMNTRQWSSSHDAGLFLESQLDASAATDESTPHVETSNSEDFNVDFQAYANGYKTAFQELPFRSCSPSSGTVPNDLIGSYYRCGPAMFSAGSIPPPKTSIIQPRDGPPVPDGQNPKRMVRHPFDGDGAILAVTFRPSLCDGNDKNDDKSEDVAGSPDGKVDENSRQSSFLPNLASPQEVTARFRYVRTRAFTNERRKGQRLYRSMDSTREMGPGIGRGLGNDLHLPLFRHHLQPGLNKNRKNTSNTRAVYWGGRLLSLVEGGQPYKLDALALSTDGSSRLGGVLAEEEIFGCKMVFDPIKNHALAYSVTNTPKSELKVFEFNDQFRLVDEGGGTVTEGLPCFGLISDMAVTSNYSIFVQPPVATSMQFVLVKEPGKVLTIENKPSMMHLIPRVGSSAKMSKCLTVPFDGFVEADVQFCNAYEDNDKIVIDAIRSDGTHKPNEVSSGSLQWPWASSREQYTMNASKKSLWRYTVDLRTGTVSKAELTQNTQCSFGVINPMMSTRKHRFIYMNVGGLGNEVAPPQGIAKFDCDTKILDSWMPQEFEFCGEPSFAAKQQTQSELADEDDGYILSVLFNGKSEESEMLVFSALDIAAGPVCRIPLGIGIPHGLHGCFTSGEKATWSAEEIERRAKLADKMESRGNQWNEVKSDFSGLGLRFDDMEEYFGDSFLS